MHNQYIIILLIAIIAFVYNRRKSHKVFIIRIRPARVKVIKGSISKKLIQDCEQIIRNQRVYGDVWGIWEGNELRTYFSKSLDESFRQKFRNVFSIDSYRYLPNKGRPDEPKGT